MKLFDINLIPVRETEDYIDYITEYEVGKSFYNKEEPYNRDYDDSDIRKYIKEIENKLDSEFKSKLLPIYKDDLLTLPTVEEVCGLESGLETECPEKQLDYFKEGKDKFNGWYWLRNKYDSTNFCFSYGHHGSASCRDASHVHYVRLMLRMKKDNDIKITKNEDSESDSDFLFPRKINILGSDYAIEFKNVEDDTRLTEGSNAYTDIYEKKIVIANLEDKKNYPYAADHPESRLARYKHTLRHEIIHAFFYESGLGPAANVDKLTWYSNETLVDFLAIQSGKLFEIFNEYNLL